MDVDYKINDVLNSDDKENLYNHLIEDNLSNNSQEFDFFFLKYNKRN